MKHQRFFHFFTKIGIISFIVIAMLCTTVQKTYALTSDAKVSDESDELSKQSKTSEPTGTPETGDGDTSQEDSDITKKSDDTDDTSDTDNDQDTDDDQDITPSEGTDDSDDSSDSQTSDSTDLPEVSDDADSTVTDTTEDSTDGDVENDTGSNTENKSDTVQTKPAEKKDVNTSSTSEVSTSANTVIQDNSSDAIYIRSDYNPSETFIALKDRVKYNEALPLDNIPSFITQEMIIGALHCQDETGYPASVTIAQIIQESGFGSYGPGGENGQGLSYLAYQYCNLFGIKGTGTAGTVNMRTGEQTSSGTYYTINAGFRVYNTYTECIEDRTKLIQDVYSDLLVGVTDANTFAMRIGSRWATSLTYSQNLIQQMECYDLYRLDSMTLKDFDEMIGKFANPCPGSYVTSSFGYRDFDHMFHKGIDLGTNQKNIPVYAAEAGTVVLAEYDSLAGNWVMIDHGNGLVTKYMHLSHDFVKEGQKVLKGQQIGLTGTTGNSTGIHLHFQVEENGVAVDPTTYLSDIKE